MANPILDQDRANFLRARDVIGKVAVPAWPRAAKELDLVEVEVEWVRFSTLNHRTRAEQRAKVAEAGDGGLFASDPLGPVAQDAQYRILIAQDGFLELKNDVGERGQQDPAIISAEGVLINGNRRAAALRSLYLEEDRISARYLKCLVLPEDATPAELVDLETELQIARDFKQQYGWINEALLIEELYDRENRDFARVATRMHRDVADVRSKYEKLQQVHQLVSMSDGTRNHIDFDDNESAFDELAKHVKNKPPSESESVRSVYFLGTLAGVRYRRLRKLRRPDAADIVRIELEDDPTLKRLLGASEEDSETKTEADLLDDVLGLEKPSSSLLPLVSLLARRAADEAIDIGDGVSVDVSEILASIESAINAAADEAEEDERDQAAQTSPLTRMDKAISEIERALAALPRARAFSSFDEIEMSTRIGSVQALVDVYRAGLT